MFYLKQGPSLTTTDFRKFKIFGNKFNQTYEEERQNYIENVYNLKKFQKLWQKFRKHLLTFEEILKN